MKLETEAIYKLLENVFDPEVPVLTIADLGVLREVKKHDDIFEIVITPTYSGCPAMKTIEEDIRRVLGESGIAKFKITTVIAPAWTTDNMSDEGKRKLKEYGIAPPTLSADDHLNLLLSGRKNTTCCPFCSSENTTLTSQFGSTACKALHFCNNCHQPFEEFKCH
jgi:ring-1,2-phenylacetyl-CoA epoxidase subunit PaaD